MTATNVNGKQVVLREVPPDASPKEVGTALSMARQAFEEWRLWSPSRRQRLLRAIRDRLLDSFDEVVATIVAETGKVVTEAAGSEIVVASEVLNYYSKETASILRTRSVPSGLLAHKRAYKRYEPLGVIGVISPWNYPLVLALGPVATALAAGNAVVLKPSEFTPRVGLLVAEIISAAVDDVGAPTGLVQAVTGAGATGEALVRSGVDKIAFTGSVRSGKAVMKAAADTLTPVLLELGGKDPMIVCKDADLGRAARAAVWGAYTNCGQTCMATERVYVVSEVYDEFVDRVTALTARLRQGSDPGDDVGAVIHEGQLKIIESHLSDAVSKGAKVLTGGGRVEVAGRPSLQPTVLVEVDHSMDVMTEETFGPILPIMKVADEDEALRLANDTRFGLNSSIFSTNRATIDKLVAGIRSGSVCVNDVMISYGIPSLPFGGVAESGFGRAHGAEGLHEMSHIKSVAEDRYGLAREPTWMPVPSWIAGGVKVGLNLRNRRLLALSGRKRTRGGTLFINGKEAK